MLTDVMDKNCKITKAEYFNDYKLLISFSDGVTNIFDFKNLVTSEREEYQPYEDITKFKKFKIQRKVNCIAWGKQNFMQIPGYILYSEKRSSKGWYLNETAYEIKKRLSKKFYYEMFVDNNVWAGIHGIIGLINGDKNADLFYKKFNNKTDSNNYLFEVLTNDFVLTIKLKQFGLEYDLMVKNICNVSYNVNFENDVKGDDLKGKDLKNYETLFKTVCGLIKKDRKNLSIRFVVVK